MSHTIREKTKLLNRVRRIRGQVDAIERALEDEAGCERVMHVIAACRGAINGLLSEVVEDHIQTHLINSLKGQNDENCAILNRAIVASGAQPMISEKSPPFAGGPESVYSTTSSPGALRFDAMKGCGTVLANAARSPALTRLPNNRLPVALS